MKFFPLPAILYEKNKPIQNDQLGFLKVFPVCGKTRMLLYLRILG